jgi:hypothetical protein
MLGSVTNNKYSGLPTNQSIFMAIRKEREEKQQEQNRICSYGNFNPVALLSFVMLLISVMLVAVSLGIDRWSEQRIRRGSGETQLDSATFKTQGLSTRCIEYMLSNEVIAQNLPSEQLPQNRCVAVGSLPCLNEQTFLFSEHDVSDIDELSNTDSNSECSNVRLRLLISFTFVILGTLAVLVAMVIMFPTWHRNFFIVGAIVNFIASILYAVALGVFIDTDRDYAGFFSINGQPNPGCLGISFGLFTGSFSISVISTLVSFVAFGYYYIQKWRSNKKSI